MVPAVGRESPVPVGALPDRAARRLRPLAPLQRAGNRDADAGSEEKRRRGQRGARDVCLPYRVPQTAMRTRQVKKNGEWTINGRKQFIPNGYDASLYVVYA